MHKSRCPHRVGDAWRHVASFNLVENIGMPRKYMQKKYILQTDLFIIRCYQNWFMDFLLITVI